MSKKGKRPLPPVPTTPDDTYLTPVQNRLDLTYDKLNSGEAYKIKVQNLRRGVTSEDLELYFESKKIFGRVLQVEKVDIGSDSRSAIITFASVADAQQVLIRHERSPCVYNDQTLHIFPLTHQAEESVTRQTEESVTRRTEEGSVEPTALYSNAGLSDEYRSNTDTIEVRGFDEHCTPDGLRFYFENERRSGGGDIVSFNLNQQKGFLLIKFMTSKVATSVVARQHKVEGCELIVRLYIISKTDLLLEEVPGDTTDEQIVNYLEAKLKSTVLSVTLNHENSKALVCFEAPYDFRKVVDVCKKFQINHINIIPQQVPVTRSIIVTNLPDDVTESSISLYFENTRRSNGGAVAETALHPDNQYCVITFTDTSVVTNVCRKSDHKIDGQHVTVKPYNELFGLPDGPEGCKLPDPVVLDKFDQDKLKFLKMNEKRKNEFEEQLKRCDAEVFWDDSPVSVECSLEKKDNKRKSLTKLWSDKVLDIVDKFMRILRVKRAKVDKSMFTAVLNELGNVNVPQSGSIAVFVNKDKCEITMVGEGESFDEAWEEIESTIDNVNVKEKQKQESVVKSKDLVKWKLNFLLACGFIQQCESGCENLKVEIFLEEGQITFTGSKHAVDGALINMFEDLQNARPYTINIGAENAKLLQNESVQEKIQHMLLEEDLMYVWDLKGDKLIIYGVEDNHLREVESVILKNLVKMTIPLDSGTEGVLQSDKWKMTEKSLRQKFKGCVEIKEGKGQLEIYTIDSLQEQVSGELREFLSKNCVYTEQMSLKPEIARYIMQVVKTTFERERKKLTDRGLKLAGLDTTSGAVTLEGTAEGIRAGKKMIQTLQGDIVAKQHTLKHERIVQYLACEKGKECMKKVEKQTPCYIDISKSSGTKSATQKKLATLAKFDQLTCCAEVENPSGIKLRVFGGDITELRVDVLVNAANKELGHRGGLARVICTKGGKVIETECNDRIQRKGRLNCGDVFVSSAGRLPCKFVVHAAGPNWNGGHQGEQALLQTTVTSCLQKAVKRKQMSIAFPALCTGIYNYPVDQSCTTIVSTVISFLKQNKTGMKEVIFCDINSRTVCAFLEALQNQFSDVKILANVTQAADSEPSRVSREREAGKVNPFGNVRVKVVKGILVKEKVDVIVNSVSTDLDLKKGALSHSVLKAAGESIQRECNTNYPDGISPGDVAVTSGGKLACSNIFHIAVKHFDPSHPSRSLHSVDSCVKACLEEADSMKMSSISFPAIGTGAQKYPKDKVAQQMFRSVRSFLKDHPRSSVTVVRFVIFTADDDTLDAFQTEENKLFKESAGSRGRSSSGSSRKPLGQLVQESRGLAEFSIGNCSLLVYEGDVTEEDADAIVASCNVDLDLTKGAVTKALLKKGGKAIQQECETQKSTMKKEGIVVTTAGQLRSKHIVHVDTKRKPWEWRPVILNALRKAEEHQLSSIAFPALGTSVGCKPAEMAAVMCEVVSEFQRKGPKYAGEVRLVIFQKEMVPGFIEGCKLSVKGHSASRRDEGRHRSHDSVFHEHKKTVKSDFEDSQTITIYADSQEKTEKAIKILERTISDEWMIKNIEDPGICSLGYNYIQQMKKESSKYHVKMEIDTDGGNIHLVGLSGNVLQVVAEVVSQLRVSEKSVYQKNQAQLMSNIVKWMYLRGHKSFPFPDNVNLEIETAYKSKHKTVKVKCAAKREFEIDFNNMEEKEVSNPGKTYPVIRRDLLNDVSAELPKSWTQMKDNENLKLVTLSNSHKEYNDVQQTLQATLGRVPNIVNIERIQNKTLYTQYAAKRKLLDQTYPKNQNERILWHGTADYAVESINAQGFNRSYCGKNAVAVGNGVYFAVNASYSDQGTYTPVGRDGNKRMYYCRVLTGKFCNGAHGMRVPPPINASKPHILYDSVTNNCSNPIMFVIFNDTQAYPEYIITYR